MHFSNTSFYVLHSRALPNRFEKLICNLYAWLHFQYEATKPGTKISNHRIFVNCHCAPYLYCKRQYTASYWQVFTHNIMMTMTAYSWNQSKSNFPISENEAWDFSILDNPALWRNGNYDSLYNLGEADLKEFFEYKAMQYEGRKELISKKCAELALEALHPSQKSTLCHQDDQRCLIVVDPKDKLAFCRNAKVSSTAWLARFHMLWQNDTEAGSIVLSKKERDNLHESAHR